MSYKRAEQVLPKEIIKLIQQYVDGQYIYIPRRDDKRKTWGEGTKVREELIERNEKIFDDYKNDLSIKELSEKYYLSEKSIQRIVYSMKRAV